MDPTGIGHRDADPLRGAAGDEGDEDSAEFREVVRAQQGCSAGLGVSADTPVWMGRPADEPGLPESGGPVCPPSGWGAGAPSLSSVAPVGAAWPERPWGRLTVAEGEKGPPCLRLGPWSGRGEPGWSAGSGGPLVAGSSGGYPRAPAGEGGVQPLWGGAGDRTTLKRERAGRVRRGLLALRASAYPPLTLRIMACARRVSICCKAAEKGAEPEWAERRVRGVRRVREVALSLVPRSAECGPAWSRWQRARRQRNCCSPCQRQELQRPLQPDQDTP